MSMSGQRPPNPPAGTPVRPAPLTYTYASMNTGRHVYVPMPPVTQSHVPPVPGQPAFRQPVAQPAYGQPVGQPAFGQPVGQPAFGQPVFGPSGFGQPRYGQGPVPFMGGSVSSMQQTNIYATAARQALQTVPTQPGYQPIVRSAEILTRHTYTMIQQAPVAVNMPGRPVIQPTAAPYQAGMPFAGPSVVRSFDSAQRYQVRYPVPAVSTPMISTVHPQQPQPMNPAPVNPIYFVPNVHLPASTGVQPRVPTALPTATVPTTTTNTTTTTLATATSSVTTWTVPTIATTSGTAGPVSMTTAAGPDVNVGGATGGVHGGAIPKRTAGRGMPRPGDDDDDVPSSVRSAG